MSSPFDIERASLRRAPDRAVAVAVIVAEDGRYLLQLRDDKPGIAVPGHWALFGGGLEPGESPATALVRELREELGFTATDYARLMESIHRMPSGRIVEMWFFTVRVRLDEIDRMVQTEGADKALFTPEEAAALDRIAPWDLSAVLLHARGALLFPR
ncbi:MAG TPA: NUDIX domain-containing protein [Stellaceae bacterium]|nr:NUDIX domain-containing protein [Stellaceae bacterium]